MSRDCAWVPKRRVYCIVVHLAIATQEKQRLLDEQLKQREAALEINKELAEVAARMHDAPISKCHGFVSA
eukprot:2431995-Pleurochrysis_carterae.AAC.1